MRDALEPAESIVTPDRCAIGFGIPTDEPGFHRSRAMSPHAFGWRCAGGWVRYETEVMAHYRKVVPVLEQLGVRVVRDLTPGALEQLFRTRDVVVLFSHSHEDTVELSDGFATADQVIRRVPEDFAGVFDLSVCHGPKALVDALDGRRLQCRVRHNAGEATPYVWLYFYRILFSMLSRGGRGYNALFSEIAAKLPEFLPQRPRRDE